MFTAKGLLRTLCLYCGAAAYSTAMAFLMPTDDIDIAVPSAGMTLFLFLGGAFVGGVFVYFWKEFSKWD